MIARQAVPLAIAIGAGLLMAVSYFLRPLGWMSESASEIFNVVSAIAFVLGAGSLLKANLSTISRRDRGWGYAAVTLGAFLVTLVVGMGKVGVNPSPSSPQAAWSGDQQTAETPFGWIYEFVLSPLSATMFALLAFFVASAAFRAFRAKNAGAAVLLVTAFVVLLGRTYAGVVLTDWMPGWASGLRLENLSNYLMGVFGSAGNRAILIGIALGVAATSLRILLGLDRSWLSREGGG
jgi:hypothetical protein